MALGNPFQVLDVPQTAALPDIQKAYKTLAKQYHPDINPSPEAASRMKEINWAKAELESDDKIAAWREKLSRPRASRGSRTEARRQSAADRGDTTGKGNIKPRTRVAVTIYPKEIRLTRGSGTGSIVAVSGAPPDSIKARYTSEHLLVRRLANTAAAQFEIKLNPDSSLAGFDKEYVEITVDGKLAGRVTASLDRATWQESRSATRQARGQQPAEDQAARQAWRPRQKGTISLSHTILRFTRPHERHEVVITTSGGDAGMVRLKADRPAIRIDRLSQSASEAKYAISIGDWPPGETAASVAIGGLNFDDRTLRIEIAIPKPAPPPPPPPRPAPPPPPPRPEPAAPAPDPDPAPRQEPRPAPPPPRRPEPAAPVGPRPFTFEPRVVTLIGNPGESVLLKVALDGTPGDAIRLRTHSARLRADAAGVTGADALFRITVAEAVRADTWDVITIAARDRESTGVSVRLLRGDSASPPPPARPAPAASGASNHGPPNGGPATGNGHRPAPSGREPVAEPTLVNDAWSGLRPPPDSGLGTLPERISFGKHRGATFADVAAQAPSYLEWMLRERVGTEEQQEAARRALAAVR